MSSGLSKSAIEFLAECAIYLVTIGFGPRAKVCVASGGVENRGFGPRVKLWCDIGRGRKSGGVEDNPSPAGTGGSTNRKSSNEDEYSGTGVKETHNFMLWELVRLNGPHRKENWRNKCQQIYN